MTIIIFFQLSETRWFEEQVAKLEVVLNPKVKIVRNLDFEKYLLRGQPNDQSSRSVVPRTQPIAKKTKIPIGARGRRRKTIMYIGLNPNLDGRTNAQNQTVESKSSSPSPDPPVRQQPAKRTYARATSTPFASVSVHRPRGLSFPLPDESTLSNVETDESRCEMTFFDGIGQLRYSSDSE